MPPVYSYKHTTHACYTAYISQAIVNNLAPLLFVIFQDQFSLSFEQVGRLILLNFGVQILADLLSVRYVDRIGYRNSALLAHLLCALGLILLGLLPALLPLPFLGLHIAVIVYALGGGLLEVLVSPIVEAMPNEDKEGSMSLLHAFYCWGQVLVVVCSTAFLRLFGSALWPLLPLLWALVPFLNFFRFRHVPIAEPAKEEKLMSLFELLKSRMFLLALLLMLCAGAAELSMSQWSSLFAERGLGVPKMLGDLLGPCLFAVFMGAGRTLYGIYGSRLNLRHSLLFCGALCVLCYLTTVFAPWPLLSLFGCALCGFSVSLMWPGTFSMSTARFPRGGTALFGMLAVFGDLGGSLGPWLTGVVSDAAQRLPAVSALALRRGEELSQLSLKAGLLAAALFPLILFIGVVFFRQEKPKEAPRPR
ncbi:MAG: MFS transporter [Provencibacterium sp.]|nr:MFS transporter [Provencibacterium sp.]